MKRLFIIITITLAAVVGVKARREPQVSKGHLDNITNFQSKYVPARTIRVWTPEDYDPNKKYDVLYMHDGLALFDGKAMWHLQEWGVDEAMDSLIRLGKIRPTIVVGIDNNEKNRAGEYCPDDIAQYLPEGKPIYKSFKPTGNAYLRFIVEELKPYIDSAYSTYPEREHTWIMGSSCGGLISSYALCKYPNIFAGAACMSTHCTLTYFDDQVPDKDRMKAYRTYLKEHLPANSALLYMDKGDQTVDMTYDKAQKAINHTLRASGWDDAHFCYRYFPWKSHTENDWRSRLPEPLLFLLQNK